MYVLLIFCHSRSCNNGS